VRWKVADESMSAWRPRATAIDGLLNISFIVRKPDPLGTEVKKLVLVQSLELWAWWKFKGVRRVWRIKDTIESLVQQLDAHYVFMVMRGLDPSEQQVKLDRMAMKGYSKSSNILPFTQKTS
jgi:hypothetical protein